LENVRVALPKAESTGRTSSEARSEEGGGLGHWACWFGSKLCQSWRYSPRLVYLWICLFLENYEGHLQPMHIVIVAQRFLVAAAAAAAAKQESQGSELRHYCNIHHGSDGYPTFDRYPGIHL